MSDTIKGYRYTALVRRVAASRKILGHDSWGTYHVLDGKVYKLEKFAGQLIGDYYKFCDDVRSGLVPGYVEGPRPE